MIISLLLSLSVGFFVIYLIILLIKHVHTMLRLQFYHKQGVTILPGAGRFIIGNVPEVAKWAKPPKLGEEPKKTLYGAILDDIDKNATHFDSVKHPMVFLNMFATPMLVVNDPQMVQDIFTTKNKSYDKMSRTQLLFGDLMGNTFLFSPGDAIWKAKRKAVAHAFFKDKIVHMTEILKGKITEQSEKWLDEIRSSPAQSTEIATNAFFDVFCRNIVHVSFGEDICDSTIEIMLPDPVEGKVAPRKLSFMKALNKVITQMVLSYTIKFYNPVNWLSY